MLEAVPPPGDASRRLDAIDRKILTVLQEDASLSVAEIGDKVGLSSTPCWKRIQRLEADGIIMRRVALVDQNKIGLGITVFVSVESGDHSDAWLKTFAEAVSAMPEVMEFYRMAGDVDYMLRVVVADMQSYDIFYKKLIKAVTLKNVTSRFADGEDQVGDGAAGAGALRTATARFHLSLERKVRSARSLPPRLTDGKLLSLFVMVLRRQAPAGRASHELGRKREYPFRPQLPC